jgi:folate-binding protein YgfZ
VQINIRSRERRTSLKTTGDEVTSVVDRSYRAKLRFTGPQALWFLDQLVTNKVDDLGQGSVSDSLLLTPNGRIRASLRISNIGSEVIVDSEPGSAKQLLEFFNERIFATRVEIEDVTSDYDLFSVFGGDFKDAVHRALHRMDSPGPLETHRFADGHLIGVGVPPQLDILVAKQESHRVLIALSEIAEQSSPEFWDAHRIIAGLPLFGVDYNDTFLPQEAARETYVHFAKGCYLGQEAVAMTQRGRIRRRLRHLRFGGGAFTGDITVEGVSVGEVTSAAAGLGIGSVATTVAVGSTVAVADETGNEALAVVRDLPGTDYGPEVPSARALRERLEHGATQT